jgi:hypothetical protein
MGWVAFNGTSPVTVRACAAPTAGMTSAGMVGKAPFRDSCSVTYWSKGVGPPTGCLAAMRLRAISISSDSCLLTAVWSSRALVSIRGPRNPSLKVEALIAPMLVVYL